MCRITTTDLYDDRRPLGGHRRLNIKAFYLKLDLLSPSDHTTHQQQQQLLQDSHILLYVPRANSNNHCSHHLHLDHEDDKKSNILLNSPGYFTLHQFTPQISGSTYHSGNCMLFGTLDKFQVEEGAMFSIYLNGEKLLKGIFKRATGENLGWTLDSTCCSLEGHSVELSQAEVSVVPDDSALRLALSTMTMRHNKVNRNRNRKRNQNQNQNQRRRLLYPSKEFQELEQIPEEGEAECECGSSGAANADVEHLCPPEELELEAEMQGLSWAVDLGIWAVGLSLGYLVSRASARRLRRIF